MKTGITRLLLLLAIALMATGPAQAAPSTELAFLGQQIFPTSTQFQGTTFGGLSSIAYDESRGVFYVLSDDQVNVRFYTLRIGVGGGAPAVQIIGVYELAKDGRYEVDYWCSVCAIAMYELKPCECCQGEIELRKRKADGK